MSSQISGVALNPQNVLLTDLNISSSVYATVVPPYQNFSSGSYLAYINGNSDICLQTRDRGNIAVNNYSYSTIPLVLLGSSNFGQGPFQNMGDFSNFPLITRYFPMTTQANAIAWNGSVWIAGGSGNSIMCRSVDGIAWVPCGLNLGGFGIWSVVWNPTNSVWLVGSSNPTLANNILGISRDNGITWTGVTNSIHGASNIPGRPFWANTLQFLGVASSNTNTLISSSNGIDWRYRTSLGSLFINHAIWNGTVFVGAALGQPLATRSFDGISWNTYSLTTGFSPRAVAYSPSLNIWQIVGQSGTTGTPFIFYSYNTTTWLPASNAPSTTGITGGFNDIIWTGTQFVTVGTFYSQAGCFTSPDGINYTSQVSTIFRGTGAEALGIAYSPTLNLYVASGYDPTNVGSAIATSSNLTTWTFNSNVFGYWGNAVTWSPEQSLFVAAGGSFSATNSNCLAYSSNGFTWFTIAANSNDNFSRGFGVVYAPELQLWVATGFTNNTILTSPNAVNWTLRPLTAGVDTNVRGLAWSPEQNQYVSVGRGSNFVIATSPDGLVWRGRGSFNIFDSTYGGNAVIWVSELSLWIALGRGSHQISTSPDGFNWTRVSPTPFTTSGNGIAWNGSLLVAVGAGTNTIATSVNGTTWTGRGATIFTTEGFSVTWNSVLQLWVAVGSGTNTIATSPDGITWTGRGATILTTSGNGVAFSRELNQLIAVGSGTINAATSSNGITWDGLGKFNTLMTTMFGIAWNGVIWVATGSGSNTVITSPDGINWTGRGTPITASSSLPGAVAWNGSLWVVCGAGATNRVATSPDGITWTGRGLVGHTSNYQVIWYPHRSIWIMTGNSSNAIFTSPDAVTWTSRTTQIMGSNRGIAYDTNGLLVLCGTSQTNFSNILQTSPDGITWTTRISTVTQVNNFNSAAYSPTLNLWVAAAQAGANSLMTSSNGTVWVPRGSSVFAGVVSHISWNNNYFVATGTNNNTVATSADGINWRPTPLLSDNSNIVTVGYRPPVMVAGGEGTYTICTSSDYGATWQPRFSEGGCINTVSWNGNIWVAGSRNGNIYTSPDAISWTERTSPFTSSINGGLWAASLRLWVLCGDYPWSFATSPDGVNWTGRVSTSLIFTRCISIEWSGGTFYGIGTGSNALATSVNGINWTGLGTPISAPRRFGTISFNGAYFAAASDQTSVVQVSTGNNASWFNRGNIPGLNLGGLVKWNGQQYVAVSANTSNRLLVSCNAINWSTIVSVLPVSTITCVNWDTINQQWYFGSEDRSINRNFLVATTDLSTFTTRINFPNMCNVTNFTWASTINLWVGTGSSNANIVTSTDGATWTQRLANSLGTAFGVAWNGSLFVAVGGNTSQFFTSPNGITWTNRTNGGVAAFSIVNGITWATSLNLWVATGENSGATQGIIATSTDGIAWTSRNTDIFTTRATHVAWNGSLFVAVGEGTNVFATSSDGITWTGRGATGITTAGRGIVWATSPGQTSLWVAVGSGTNSIATSPDGITWTGRTTTSIFSVQGNEVVNNGSVTVAVGEGTNTYAWSYDNGATWTGGGTSSFTLAGTALGWSPTTGQWVGGSSNIPYFLSSPDGRHWTPRTCFTSSVQVVAMQTREKTFTINNSNWTGRTSQQNFRILA